MSSHPHDIQNQIFFVNPSYRPRYYQQAVFQALNEGKKRLYLVWHRRAGKDKTCFEALLWQAHKRAGNYWYMFPTLAQGRKAFWESIDASGNRIIDNIPEAFIYKKKNETSMTFYIKTIDNLHNGATKSHSTIQVVGVDKVEESLRGSNPVGVLGSEFASWRSQNILEEKIEPILRENGGFLILNTTPAGKNKAYHLFKAAEDNPAWFTSRLTIEQTYKLDPVTQKKKRIVSTKDIEEIRSMKQTPESIIQQEYYCDWNAPQTGTFYSEAIKLLEERKAIRPLTYNPDLPTFTAWDLGLNDATAIWWFQYDHTTNQLYAIDYEEYISTPLPTICHQVLHTKPYKTIEAHIAPHDIVHRSYESGLTRVQIAQRHGINFTDEANSVTKAKKLPILDGIEHTRKLIPRTYFCSINAEDGLKCLENYKRKYDRDTNTYYNTPIHDQFSHGADAFRTFAVWFADNETQLKRKYNLDNFSNTPIRAILPTSIFEA